MLKATINLRLATKEDLVYNSKLLIGVKYYVLNNQSNSLSGLHETNEDTNKEELASFHKQKRVYVFVSCLDSPIIYEMFHKSELEPELNN